MKIPVQSRQCSDISGQLHSTRRLTPANGATKGLILANVAVYLLSKVADAKFIRQNFTVHLDNFNSGRYHTMITSAFSHKDFLHILPNIIALYSYGKRIEQRFGPEFLLKLYLAGAFTGSVSFLLHRVFLALSSKDKQSCESDRSKVAAYGASDAVMAILMLDTLLTPVNISLGKFTIPAHALLAGSYIWDDIQKLKEDKIAGSAHLGGAAVGIITWAWLRKGRL
ncbi:putative rhomboid protease [Helianthus debilis subsp. tardiflorus]